MKTNKQPIGWCLECGTPIYREQIRLKDSISREEINEFRRKLREKKPFIKGLENSNVISEDYSDGIVKMIKFVDLMLGKMTGEQEDGKEK